MSGPKARKAVLFKRAVLRSRGHEQSARREPDGVFEHSGKNRSSGDEDTGVRAQQMKIRAAFGDVDAA